MYSQHGRRPSFRCRLHVPSRMPCMSRVLHGGPVRSCMWVVLQQLPIAMMPAYSSPRWFAHPGRDPQCPPQQPCPLAPPPRTAPRQHPPLSVPAARITVVRTAQQLQEAAAGAAQDVEVQAHLDLRPLSKALNPDHPGLEWATAQQSFSLLYASPPLRSIRVRLRPFSHQQLQLGPRLSHQRLQLGRRMLAGRRLADVFHFYTPATRALCGGDDATLHPPSSRCCECCALAAVLLARSQECHGPLAPFMHQRQCKS